MNFVIPNAPLATLLDLYFIYLLIFEDNTKLTKPEHMGHSSNTR